MVIYTAAIIGILVPIYSAITHFKTENEIQSQRGLGCAPLLNTLIVSIVIFKDIMYTVLYPHVGYISAYVLWMSILAPMFYIYTRTALGNRNLKTSLLVFVGYNWQKEDMAPKKRLNLILVLAFQ